MRRRNRWRGIPDNRWFARGLQQVFAPSCESRSDLIGIFFRDEIVEACLHFEQRRIERTIVPVVRMQRKVSAARQRIPSRGPRLWERDAPQAARNQGRSGPLAKAHEKIPAAKIDRRVRSTCPAQSVVSQGRESRCGTEATIRLRQRSASRTRFFILFPAGVGRSTYFNSVFSTSARRAPAVAMRRLASLCACVSYTESGTMV